MAKETKKTKKKPNNKETLGFETEVNQLLKLMVHSLYSNKEIFLRELLSNASDACDKLRFEALRDNSIFEDDPELGITVAYDAGEKTITISDNGIGMSRDEVIDNIGTIAKSGTKEFFAKLTGDQAKDASLIGQFGVGFYSAFIVGKKVSLTTRRAGVSKNDGVKWTSVGEGDYTLEPVSKKQRGTEVTIELKDGEEDLLSSMRLKTIVTKYSDHIAIPIMMLGEDWDKDKSEYIKTDELEQINQASAIWVRAKSDISEDQYKEFYKHLGHDLEAPLAWTHNKVEGRQEYTQLLYLPSKAPFDLFERDSRHGVKLYVKRVFIMDDAENLIPNYLRFVKGVIDSSDLPLNISREILQESKDVEVIRKGCVSRILGLLEGMASENVDKYLGFWKEFGRVLKEGIGEDFGNQERISKLLRFATTKTEGEKQSVSFSEYVDRMKDGQDKIYFVTADTFNSAASSPHLEIFGEKDIEVLLLYDRVDEWVVSNLPEFDGKKLVSISKGELDLGEIAEDEKSEREKETENFKELVGRIKEKLNEKVTEVRVTFRLKDSPACLVAEENGMSINLERMLKAAGQNVPSSKPILEINPYHPIVKRLQSSTDEQSLTDWSKILFDQAVLAEGGTPDDPAQFVKLLNSMMIKLTGDEKKVWTPS